MIDTKTFLKQYQNREIKFIPNPGNAGDSFIAYATVQMFKELNLNYQICKPDDKFNNDTIIFGGGGNLAPKYDTCKKFLLHNHRNNKIVVLPHVVNNCDDLLTNLSNNVTIFAREKVSYNYMKTKMRYLTNALISDDMAFHVKHLDKYKHTSCIGECNVFRIDDELRPKNNHVTTPKNNKDISIDFQRPMYMKNWYISDDNNTQVEQNISIATDNIFSYISKFEQINTNRLHIGIAATLLGKRVNLYPGSYYKIAAVYDYSIKDKFDNVTFHRSNI